MNSMVEQGDESINKHHLIAVSVIAGWFILIVSLGMSGAYSINASEAPTTLIMSFISVYSIFALSYIKFPMVKKYILNLDMRFLIMLNSWRMIGMGFIMLSMFSHLPYLFAYVAGLGDALTAVGAVFLAFKLMKRKQGVDRKTILRWNTFGLVDFVLAVSIGLLTRTDAWLMQSNGVNSDMMVLFPMVIIPGFLVQLLSLTHIIIYLQLKNNHIDQAMIKIN